MKRMSLYLIVALMISTLPAVADNFAPPDYVGDPLSYHAQWEFTNSLATGFLPDIVSYGGSNTTEYLYNGETLIRTNESGWVWDGSNGILNPTQDSVLEIDVMNWVDDEPVKYLRVQLTHTSVSVIEPPPTVEGATGYKDGITTGYFPAILSGTGNSQQSYFDITMTPNPDWETIKIDVPQGRVIYEIVVDTISIPEPSVIVLVSLMGGAILFIRTRLML